MRTPKISIVVPCYNIELFIAKCISSILKQTYQDFELLLINDGSTDNTLKMLSDFEKKDSRIKVVSHQNKGVSFTRNKGVELAIAPFIMFVDGDDYIKEDFLQTHMNDHQSGISVISGFINVKQNVENDNENFKKLLKRFPKGKLEKKNILKLLKYDSLSSPCCRIYEKNIIVSNNILFKEDVSYQEDLLFNIEYYKHISSFQILDYFGYYYIEHPVSSSIRYHKSLEHTEELFKILKSEIKDEEDISTAKEFIFQTLMKKIANIYHQASSISSKTQYNEMKSIIFSEDFSFTSNYIKKTKINVLLLNLLKNKNIIGIHSYFKLRFFLKK